VGTLNLLGQSDFSGIPLRLYNAGSGGCFGDTSDSEADENPPFRPRSPYAVARPPRSRRWQTTARRARCAPARAFSLKPTNRRCGRNFVTRKIMAAVCRIAAGSGERLRRGTELPNPEFS
jgi:GDPmannose 4,6-dehydratase